MQANLVVDQTPANRDKCGYINTALLLYVPCLHLLTCGMVWGSCLYLLAFDVVMDFTRQFRAELTLYLL